jgi:predicted ester cyclase
MSVKENIELVYQYFSIKPSTETIQKIMKTNDKITEIEKFFRPYVEKLFALNFILHMSGSDGNRERVIKENLALVTAFPDAFFSIDKILAEGEIVVVLGRLIGTNIGPYNKLPATGKKMEIGYLNMYRITEGKFVEAWVYMDMLHFMMQLGAIPSTLLLMTT